MARRNIYYIFPHRKQKVISLDKLLRRQHSVRRFDLLRVPHICSTAGGGGGGAFSQYFKPGMVIFQGGEEKN